jgi:hypothetical protein
LDHDAELIKANGVVALSRLFLFGALVAGIALCNGGVQARTEPCRTPQLRTTDDHYAVCVTSERIEFWVPPGSWVLGSGRLIAQFALIDGREKPMTPMQFLEHASRKSVVVTFKDSLEGWELFFGTDAPVIYEGFVHDYRSDEALPEKGGVVRRRFIFPAPPIEMRHLKGAVLEIQTASRRYYFNLDVRREVAAPSER